MKRYLILLYCCLPFLGSGQIIETWAGVGTSGINSGDNGQAISAVINYPLGGVFDKSGNYYFTTGTTGNTIRKITPNGIITTVAGTGSSGYAGDGGPAINAEFHNPQGLSVDTLGNIYVADAQNNCVRKIDITTGIITTIGGNGVAGYSGDSGLAISAQIFDPLDICTDKKGNIYIADYVNSRVRRIDAAGIITTFAGNGISGYSGDGGPSSQASIFGAWGLCSDDTGNIYIADERTIRKVDTNGIITTVAGIGIGNSTGSGGPAILAEVAANKIAIDKAGNLYFAEMSFHKIRMVTPAGIVNDVIGDGNAGSTGDGGTALLARVNYPGGVAVDSCGNLYVCEGHGFRIRKVSFNPNCFPLSINEKTPLTFTLSPNPTTSHITITSSTQLKKLHLANTLGATILQQEINANKTTLDLANQPAGIYILTLYDEHGNRKTEKIIKQ